MFSPGVQRLGPSAAISLVHLLIGCHESLYETCNMSDTHFVMQLLIYGFRLSRARY